MKNVFILLCLPIIVVSQPIDFISDLNEDKWEKLTTADLSSNLVTDFKTICGIQYCSYLSYTQINDLSLNQFNSIWHYAQGTKYSLESTFDKVKVDFCYKRSSDYAEPEKSYLSKLDSDSNYYKESFCYILYTINHIKNINKWNDFIDSVSFYFDCNTPLDQKKKYCLFRYPDYYEAKKSGMLDKDPDNPYDSDYCVDVKCKNQFVKFKFNDGGNKRYILASNDLIIEDLNKYYDFDNDGFLDKLIGIEWYDRWPIAAITKRKIDGLYEFIFFNMMSEEGKKKAEELSDWY